MHSSILTSFLFTSSSNLLQTISHSSTYVTNYCYYSFFHSQALTFKCVETLAFCPDHPVLQVGTIVHIGLDKTTKLSAVFARYVQVCNEQCPTHKVQVADLEFVHTHVLSTTHSSSWSANPTSNVNANNDTAESAALMKHDQVTVRRDRTMMRQEEVAFHRVQRDSDRDYFAQLRKLSTSSSAATAAWLAPRPAACDVGLDDVFPWYADALLDCRGPRMGQQQVIMNPTRSADGADPTRHDYSQAPPPSLKKSHAIASYNSLDSPLSQPANKSIRDTPTPKAMESSSSLSSFSLVPCHSVLMYHRCPWLGRMIANARSAQKIQQREQAISRERNRKVGIDGFTTVPPEDSDNCERENGKRMADNNSDSRSNCSSSDSNALAAISDSQQQNQDWDDDDFERMQQVQREHKREVPPPNDNMDVVAVAAEIENDDEEQQQQPLLDDIVHHGGDCGIVSGGMVGCSNDNSIRNPADSDSWPSNMIYVLVENHSPEAMTLLLEYCYSNRVVSLGCEAFVKACRTKPQYKKLQGPVPPFSLRAARWPENGEPVVSLAVALAGIRLAEEAQMPRFSLMCEVAASQLVADNATAAVKALEVCGTQEQATGNSLPLLRKAAMNVVFRAHHMPTSRGITGVLSSALLQEQGSMLVPTLMNGTMEAVEANYFGKDARNSFANNINSISVLVSATAAKINLPTTDAEKRDWRAMASSHFERLDDIDIIERDLERRKRLALWDGDKKSKEKGRTRVYASRRAYPNKDSLLTIWGSDMDDNKNKSTKSTTGDEALIGNKNSSRSRRRGA